MGRKKIIETEQLIGLVDEFYYKVCKGNADKLKIPEIGQYVRSNGYPELKDYVIRRNEQVITHIEELKQTSEKKELSLVVAYKTIDIENFINTNRSDTKMKKALSELNMYYKTICDAATLINEKAKRSESKRKELEKKLNETQAELEILRTKNANLENEKKQLSAENKKLKQIINTYVYPEIANELLAKEGLLQNTAGIVIEDAVEENLVKPETTVRSDSNVIKGMFNKFGV